MPPPPAPLRTAPAWGCVGWGGIPYGYISILDIGYWISILSIITHIPGAYSWPSSWPYSWPNPTNRLYKAPTDYTKPQQTIQSPNRQYKAPTDNTKPQQTIQNPDILDKDPTDNTKPRSPTISNAILNMI